MADYSKDISESLHLTAGVTPRMATTHIVLSSGTTLTGVFSDIIYLAFNSVNLTSGITLTGTTARSKHYLVVGAIASTSTLGSSIAKRKDYVADGAIDSTITITPSVTIEEFEIFTPLTTKTHWFIISGNLAQDVADQLSDQGVPEHKVKAFFYDSDNNKYVALYHR